MTLTEKVLRALVERADAQGNITVASRALARDLGVNKVSVGRARTNLLKRGLMEVTKETPRLEGPSTWRVTDQGEAMLRGDR